MHRFGSGAAAMAEQTPGRLLQNIMSKTLDLAFPQYDTVPYDDEDADADENRPGSRKYIRNKVWRSRCCLRDEAQSMRMAAVTFCLAPLHWLFARLQVVDEQDWALYDLICGGQRNPLMQAMVDLAEQVNNGAHARLSVLFRHYELSPEKLTDLQDICFSMILEAYVLLWFFFGAGLGRFPFFVHLNVGQR
jgi:hypothetical protein